ncbi:MAG: UDP-N-acetylmuramoyl-L-alanine--D-glutamate ligase [Mariprofundaceae bacterium]|nr:UDP-N-acetylmuramoyl-L-alanine--D-glutamate ligase [Mariprofundaceae bacterium]
MQKTAVIGMGKTGCSIVSFLLSQGIECDAFDENNIDLDPSLTCRLYCGPLQAQQLEAYDSLALSPGISWQHPVLQQLRSQGKKMLSDLELFAQHFKGDTIAITGTNGKTTVTTLLHQLMNIPALGNIGTPMLDALADQHSQAVLELSSFQLQRSAPIHSKYAVLLNLQPDHVDMHADAEEYKQAKLRVFAKQQQGDWAMLPADHEWDEQANRLQKRGVCVRRVGGTSPHTDVGIRQSDQGNTVFWQQGQYSMPCADIAIQGSHQYLNLAIVAQIATDLDQDQEKIIHMMHHFSGLPHRMQYVGHYHGRDWFNDSKATNPDAAIAALQSCQKVTWICGGLRKGIDLTPMTKTVAQHVDHAWVIGTEPEAYVAMLQEAGVSYQVVGHLAAAVTAAKAANNKLPVLLSPASASMDQFLNYAERGEVFMELAKAEVSQT